MSIIYLIVIITDVGMWVTPKRLTDEVYSNIFGVIHIPTSDKQMRFAPL
jgi:hypothetical protein